MIIGISLFILIVGFGWVAWQITKIIIEKIKNDIEDY